MRPFSGSSLRPFNAQRSNFIVRHFDSVQEPRHAGHQRALLRTRALSGESSQPEDPSTATTSPNSAVDEGKGSHQRGSQQQEPTWTGNGTRYVQQPAQPPSSGDTQQPQRPRRLPEDVLEGRNEYLNSPLMIYLNSVGQSVDMAEVSRLYDVAPPDTPLAANALLRRIAEVVSALPSSQRAAYHDLFVRASEALTAMRVGSKRQYLYLLPIYLVPNMTLPWSKLERVQKCTERALQRCPILFPSNAVAFLGQYGRMRLTMSPETEAIIMTALEGAVAREVMTLGAVIRVVNSLRQCRMEASLRKALVLFNPILERAYYFGSLAPEACRRLVWAYVAVDVRMPVWVEDMQARMVGHVASSPPDRAAAAYGAAGAEDEEGSDDDLDEERGSPKDDEVLLTALEAEAEQIFSSSDEEWMAGLKGVPTEAAPASPGWYDGRRPPGTAGGAGASTSTARETPSPQPDNAASAAVHAAALTALRRRVRDETDPRRLLELLDTPPPSMNPLPVEMITEIVNRMADFSLTLKSGRPSLVLRYRIDRFTDDKGDIKPPSMPFLVRSSSPSPAATYNGRRAQGTASSNANGSSTPSMNSSNDSNSSSSSTPKDRIQRGGKGGKGRDPSPAPAAVPSSRSPSPSSSPTATAPNPTPTPPPSILSDNTWSVSQEDLRAGYLKAFDLLMAQEADLTTKQALVPVVWEASYAFDLRPEELQPLQQRFLDFVAHQRLYPATAFRVLSVCSRLHVRPTNKALVVLMQALSQAAARPELLDTYKQGMILYAFSSLGMVEEFRRCSKWFLTSLVPALAEAGPGGEYKQGSLLRSRLALAFSNLAIPVPSWLLGTSKDPTRADVAVTVAAIDAACAAATIGASVPAATASAAAAAAAAGSAANSTAIDKRKAKLMRRAAAAAAAAAGQAPAKPPPTPFSLPVPYEQLWEEPDIEAPSPKTEALFKAIAKDPDDFSAAVKPADLVRFLMSVARRRVTRSVTSIAFGVLKGDPPFAMTASNTISFCTHFEGWRPVLKRMLSMGRLNAAEIVLIWVAFKEARYKPDSDILRWLEVATKDSLRQMTDDEISRILWAAAVTGITFLSELGGALCQELWTRAPMMDAAPACRSFYALAIYVECVHVTSSRSGYELSLENSTRSITAFQALARRIGALPEWDFLLDERSTGQVVSAIRLLRSSNGPEIRKVPELIPAERLDDFFARFRALVAAGRDPQRVSKLQGEATKTITEFFNLFNQYSETQISSVFKVAFPNSFRGVEDYPIELRADEVRIERITDDGLHAVDLSFENNAKNRRLAVEIDGPLHHTLHLDVSTGKAQMGITGRTRARQRLLILSGWHALMLNAGDVNNIREMRESLDKLGPLPVLRERLARRAESLPSLAELDVTELMDYLRNWVKDRLNSNMVQDMQQFKVLGMGAAHVKQQAAAAAAAAKYEKSDQHMKLLDTYPFLSGSFAGSLMFNDATFLCLLSLNATKQIAEHEKRTAGGPDAELEQLDNRISEVSDALGIIPLREVKQLAVMLMLAYKCMGGRDMAGMVLAECVCGHHALVGEGKYRNMEGFRAVMTELMALCETAGHTDLIQPMAPAQDEESRRETMRGMVEQIRVWKAEFYSKSNFEDEEESVGAMLAAMLYPLGLPDSHPLYTSTQGKPISQGGPRRKLTSK